MRPLFQAYKGVVRGASSGWMVSVLFHAGIFVIAVSVYLVLPEEKTAADFWPVVLPERPAMKLPRPPVRINQAPKPQRQMERIAVERQAVDQPVFQVPDLELGQEMPVLVISDDFGAQDIEPTLVGEKWNSGFGFEGTFYDLKRGRGGQAAVMDPHQFVEAVARFVRSGWKTSTLSRYYRSPNKLFAECFMVPPVKSSVAPAAFDEDDTLGYCWLAHYQGKLVYHEDITFRFRGHGDDILAVRVDGKEVLVACWPGSTWAPQAAVTAAAGGWQSPAAASRIYSMGNNTAVVGDWITLKANEALDMEVIIGEVPGGTFCSMLTVEVQGVDYPLNRQQGPILPMFKTSEPSRVLKDRILEWMTFDHAAVEGGPVFRDIPPPETAAPVLAVQEPEASAEGESALRLWEIGGQSVEAAFQAVVGNKVMLKGARGKQIKVPLGGLSAADRRYIELARPPEFRITFTKQSGQRILKTTPHLEEIPPRILDYRFGAKIRQVSAQDYDHEITAELFVIGRQRIDDRKYILLDRFSSSFRGVEHTFKGDAVELMSYDTDQPMGRKYSDYLLILTDERGKIIQHSASAGWLFPNLEKLRGLQVGSFMDKTCTRVYPTGPGPRSLYN